MTSQPSVLPPQTQPIGQLLRGSPVLSGEGVRLIVRSYFVSSGFTSELVLGMPRADSVPTSKPGRSQSRSSLGQFQPFQELVGMRQHRVGAPVVRSARPAQVTPGRRPAVAMPAARPACMSRRSSPT